MIVTETRIDLPAIRLHGRHGVMPQERSVGNEFTVSLSVVYDAEKAALTDDVAYALNYAELVETVRQINARPYNLLEAFGRAIAEALVRRFACIESGEVTVAKQHAPIPGPAGPASVRVAFTR